MVAVEKSADELRKEIDELHRQQREITDRLRDPRGIRRGGLIANNGNRSFGNNGAVGRQRGFVRPAGRVDAEDEPAPKRRLSSAVVKIKDEDVAEDGEVAADGTEDVVQRDSVAEGDVSATASRGERRFLNVQQRRGDYSRRDNNRRPFREDYETSTEHVPRVLPKDEDPRLVNRNKRILGQLLGTLEKFQKEDKQLASTEAYMRRSDSLQRAEQRAREESERLRLQEREKISENRRRDLTLRARVAAKAEEKKLELLFLHWKEHHIKLSNFLRTKTEPAIYYLPVKSLEEDVTLVEQRNEKVLLEWTTTRREELSQYQKQVGEQYMAKVETDLDRWQNGRSSRRGGNNNMSNLQETMDKELETHQLEHGPKTRKIPGNNEDEDDVEDINVEDDLMEDMLVADDNNRRVGVDDGPKPEAGDASPSPDDLQ
ncbi:hypothetical protein GIB67_017853 [Kingdonia uniflora]|uniref:Pinin/SDK/MemA protein domain-containing protein n=1 Tax=Kingdonia uniflora TaxID=39325 RepID=A0A7J7ML87_9MAGN|nr:hypothetical protein GIB67_017853 [Kingdonia uniflora]